MKISALILAAGKGSRIGTPKLMLEVNDKSFVNVIIDKVRRAGIKDVVCVVSEETYKWAKENIKHCRIVVNPEPEKGMITSVYFGAMQINDCAGIMIIPVDHPFIKSETIKILLSKAEENSDSIIKPRFEGKSGHPVIVPYKLIKTITKENFGDGLNDVIKKSGNRQVYADVNDNGILKNINTKEDYNNG